MMKKTVKIFISLLLVMLCALPVAAGDVSEVAWTLSDDGESLSDGTRKYEYINSMESLGLENDARRIDIYEGYLEGYEVQVNSDFPEVAWLIGADEYLFVTEKGREIIFDFLHNDKAIYRMCEPSSPISSEMPDGLMYAIEHCENKFSVDVTLLKDCEYYEIKAHDVSRSVSKLYGAIYVFEERYCFINYEKLDNNYFDADGNFSYRKGIVPAIYIDEGFDRAIEGLISDFEMERTHLNWSYNMDIDEEPARDEGVAKVMLTIGIILAGFVFPIPFLVLGITLPNSKKLGKPKYWYILAAIAGLWILLAAIISIVLFALI